MCWFLVVGLDWLARHFDGMVGQVGPARGRNKLHHNGDLSGVLAVHDTNSS